MEFYIVLAPIKMFFIEVSIPNGMEFYMDEFTKCEALTFVSIPNGMEFYRAWSLGRYGRTRFQFPTGWNSTQGASG